MAATLAGMQLTLIADEERIVDPMLTMDPMASEIRPTFSGSYLASQVASMRQDYDTAADFAKETLAYKPQSEQLRRRNLRLLVAAGDMKAAESLAAKMNELDDSLVTMVRLGELVRAGEFTAAEALLPDTPDSGIYRLLSPVIAAWVKAGQRAQTQEEPAPLLEFEGVPMQGALRTFLQYQRGLINDWLGNIEQARAAYMVAASSPEQTPYRVVQAIANFYLRQGEIDKAEALYKNHSVHHPDSDFDAPELPDTPAKARNIAPIISHPAEGIAEIYFTAASLLFGEQISQETVLYLQLALALRPDFPAAQMLLANLHEQRDDHHKAVAIYQSIDPESMFYRQGRIRIALNYHAAGQTQQAVRLLKSMIDEQPDHEEAILLLGDMYRRQEAYRTASNVFERAIKRLPEHGWSWRFYYKYAIALERAGKWDKAETMFDQALKQEPEQPDVLNYLGYSWLEQNKNFEQAKEMIELAYVQEPDQAHIIDSMGWAHYKLGEYDKALPLLEEAVELAPQDPTVNDHLGDVYWRVGRRQEARFQWQRALTFEVDDPQAVRDKLKEGLPPITNQAPASDASRSNE